MSLLVYCLIILVVLVVTLAMFLMVSMRPTKGRKIDTYQNPRKALLVVDIQEDYTGATAPPSSPFKNTAALVATVNQVIEAAVKKDVIIAYIGHEWPDNIFYRVISRGMTLAGQPGTRQDDRLIMASPCYFRKHRSDAFSSPELENFLIQNQVDEVFIIGLDAAFCAYKTAIGALNRNYKVTIITDAVTTCTKRTREELTRMYQRKGISAVESAEFISDRV